jgi:hypothetical protein
VEEVELEKVGLEAGCLGGGGDVGGQFGGGWGCEVGGCEGLGTWSAEGGEVLLVS